MTAGPLALRDWLIVAPLAVPIATGALLVMLRQAIRWHALIAVAGLCAAGLTNAALLSRVLADGPAVMTMGGWLPPFGISFTVDALGAGFALVATLVLLAGAAQGAREIDANGRRYGFYAFLMLMTAGVNGAFLTGDIFNLYVWFEVFLISSFGLLVLGSTRLQIEGAVKYAVLNLIATALFLIATAYLYGALGTLNMADLVRKAPMAQAAPLTTIAALFTMAFAMKAAAFPLQGWLPASYHTPPALVGALFGGILTKIGVYALLRVLVMILPAERDIFAGLLTAMAMATMLLGAVGALAQNDIRRMAGYLVISGVGFMLAGVALGGAGAIAGAILYALHSMLALSALYLLTGIVEKAGGSAGLDRLGGIYRASPLLSAVAFLLVLAVAGLPPGSGLWPKVMLVQAAITADGWWLTAALLVASLLTTLALGRFFLLAFWREREGETAARPSAPLLALTLGVVAFGLWPQPLVAVAQQATRGLLDSRAYVDAVFPEGAAR